MKSRNIIRGTIEYNNMAEKYLLFSLDDEASKRLGEVISNPTCKKIANLLAEKELSEKDIADELRIPLNTVGYNIKKLLEAGIAEKAKAHFWSVKGKRIETYRIVNKLIVISPKKSNIYSKLKGIVPVALISGILAAFISWYYKSVQLASYGGQKAVEKAAEYAGEASISAPAASTAVEFIQNIPHTEWIFFALGSLVAVTAFLIWNWKKL